MSQGSTFAGRTIWSGRPRVIATPPFFRLFALAMALVAAVSTSFAVVVASALQAEVGSLLAFAAWCGTLALFLAKGPAIWRSELEYFVTEEQVVYQRGPFRRVIARHGISYARIHWHPSLPGTGDLELVRAVPTGALRRSLVLTLPGLEAPDALWALIRSAPASESSLGEPCPRSDQRSSADPKSMPISQRLEAGERVLWSERPRIDWRSHIPAEPRDLGMLALALLVAAVLARQLLIAIPVTKQVLAAGIPVRSLAFVALMAAFGLSSLLLLGVALGLGYVGVLRPSRRWRETRYFVTDRRVLIQRGREELSLDRSRIVDIIHAPRRRGVHDLFLVLDGPRARALATSGAFGKGRRRDTLMPVLHGIPDAEAVSRILRSPQDAESARPSQASDGRVSGP